MTHRLDPLLRPRSIAVIGASAREDSMGEWCLLNLERGGFDGPVYPVNPGYEELRGLRCYPSLDELPEVPDVVMFAVGDHRLEASLDNAIDCGVPAAVIMSSLYLDDDGEPALKERVRQKIEGAGMIVCGGNGMGFYNVRDNTWCCGFDSTMHYPPGNVSLISQSGSGMCGIIDCDARVRVNLAVSSGSELSVTMDEYLDFALDLPETKVVGLFVETARNPEGFRDALAKAADKQIPIVAIKVGKTDRAAALTVSHSGAMAGDDATYDALFDRYGVHRVDDMDEMATALILFAELGPLGSGGLVTLHDSGGERQLMADLAHAAGVPLTELNEATTKQLRDVLEPELPAVNPLDAWSRGGDTASEIMMQSLAIMLSDPDAAIGVMANDRAPDGVIYEANIRYVEGAREATGKPTAVVASRQGSGVDPLVVEATHRGYPVLDGVVPFLRAVRGMMDHRDFLARPAMETSQADESVVARWRQRLESVDALDEVSALAMFNDFGVNASRAQAVDSEKGLLEMASGMRYPLVLKTAVPGIHHKTEHRGVHLNLGDESALVNAWKDLAGRLGPEALVAEMAPCGVDMILGAKRDPQFGPIVILGFGGIHAEVLKDVSFLMPPFDAAAARRHVDKLRLRPLLDGVRGAPPANVDAFCAVASAFSVMVHALRDRLAEVDVNPVIVTDEGAVAVDALVVTHANKGEAS
jgi:acyl-CoA synthetase (NDP forming)